MLFLYSFLYFIKLFFPLVKKNVFPCNEDIVYYNFFFILLGCYFAINVRFS